MSLLNEILNGLAFLLWFYAWMPDVRDIYFNPYVGYVRRAGDFIIRAVRPLFFGAPDRVVAGVTAAAIVILRGVLCSGHVALRVVFGFHQFICVPGDGVPHYVAASVVSFALFLFKVWGLSLLLVRRDQAMAFDRAEATAAHLCQPFIRLRYAARIPALAGMGFACIAAMMVLQAPSVFQAPLFFGVQALISVVKEWVMVLPLAASLMIVTIIGSWVAMLSASHGLMHFCNEWLSFLMGPLRNRQIRIGMLDLMPLVVVLAIQYITPWIVMGLAWLLDKAT